MSGKLIALSLFAFLSLGLVQGAEPPKLPGPALDWPVDLNGDSISSFGDRYVFNDWLALGGNLDFAISSVKVVAESGGGG